MKTPVEASRPERASDEGVTMVSQPAVPSPAPGKALHSFHPGWYGAVMGTAILGVAAFMNPGSLPALNAPLSALGIAMWLVACLVAVVLGVPYLLATDVALPLGLGVALSLDE